MRRLKIACWEVSQTLGMERNDCMNGRKRKVQIKFYVTEEERALIEQKMKLVPTQNMAAYSLINFLSNFQTDESNRSVEHSHILLKPIV